MKFNPRPDHLAKLARLYLSFRPIPELPPDWRGRVMAAINLSAMDKPHAIWAEVKRKNLADFSLRFAGAACLAAVALCLYAVLYGPDLEAQAARLFMDYPDLYRYLSEISWT